MTIPLDPGPPHVWNAVILMAVFAITGVAAWFAMRDSVHEHGGRRAA